MKIGKKIENFDLILESGLKTNINEFFKKKNIGDLVNQTKFN